jgi:hypothetical protein
MLDAAFTGRELIGTGGAAEMMRDLRSTGTFAYSTDSLGSYGALDPRGARYPPISEAILGLNEPAWRALGTPNRPSGTDWMSRRIPSM